MSTENVILEVSHLKQNFGNHEVLKDIDFKVHTGDVVSVIGAVAPRYLRGLRRNRQRAPDR